MIGSNVKSLQLLQSQIWETITHDPGVSSEVQKLLEKASDAIEHLDTELSEAVRVAYRTDHPPAKEWVHLNHPNHPCLRGG